MDSVLETMQDYQDVEEALREGFKNLPAAGDSVDEAELESELNELIREGAEEEERARAKEEPPVIPVADNRVRVGKRVLDLTDFPEVPTGGIPSTATPASSSHSAENGDNSLEERWKRLRMHAT